MDPLIPAKELSEFQSAQWLRTTGQILSRDEPVGPFPVRTPTSHQEHGFYLGSYGRLSPWRFDANELFKEEEDHPEMWAPVNRTALTESWFSGGTFSAQELAEAKARRRVEREKLRRVCGGIVRNLVEGFYRLSPGATSRPIYMRDFVHRFRGEDDIRAALTCGEQYAFLPSGSDEPSDVACKMANRRKNRFSDVLPYDDESKRVIMHWWSPEGSGDLTDFDKKYGFDLSYINASYVHGVNHPKEFIATQAPILGMTRVDFWRMVWEQNTRCVIDLTTLDDYHDHKLRVDYYLPFAKDDDHNVVMKCGDFDMMVLNPYEVEERDGCWTFREIQITFKMPSMRKVVQHWHYRGWPRRGIPEHPQALLSFMKAVRYLNPSEKTAKEGAIVVVGVAGIGRPACYIALDRIFEQLKIFEHDQAKIVRKQGNSISQGLRIPYSKPFIEVPKSSASGGAVISNAGEILVDYYGADTYIDIFAIVRDMRLSRRNMVQGTRQYWFLHKFMAMALENKCLGWPSDEPPPESWFDVPEMWQYRAGSERKLREGVEFKEESRNIFER